MTLIGGFFKFVDHRFSGVFIGNRETVFPLARALFLPFAIDGIEIARKGLSSFFACSRAPIFQYSTGIKASISFSRSTTSFKATDWTLPAESPPSRAPCTRRVKIGEIL